jgi:hypothetical protein
MRDDLWCPHGQVPHDCDRCQFAQACNLAWAHGVDVYAEMAEALRECGFTVTPPEGWGARRGREP